jgi:hypothetical protein
MDVEQQGSGFNPGMDSSGALIHTTTGSVDQGAYHFTRFTCLQLAV